MDQQRRHEAPEIGAMVKRMMRALVRRAAEGDIEALEQLHQIATDAPTALTTAGVLMHREDGAAYSYTFLGDVLGTTRQAARQRFNTDPDHYYGG